MSTFVRFDGKNYKLPDALILGRGEPFAVTDRTLARAHARIVFRNGIWKIKDLNSDTGITLNGKKIKPAKFFQVHPGDTILLGNVPLEIHESFEEGHYVEVHNFATHDVNDYSPLIYGTLFFLAILIMWTQSTGDNIQDIVFLALSAAFLKGASIATHALRTIYFPVQFVKEANFTYEGATFHITSEKNFSLKFEDVTKWFIVGKCFFITAYKKELIYVLNEGHEELASLLNDRCSKKRATAEPILEKMALMPFLFSAFGIALISFTDSRILQFMGHGFAVVGSAGISAFFFSEQLRELLPFWGDNKQPKNLGPALALVTVCLLMYQFTLFVGQYRTTKFKHQLAVCSENVKKCDSVKFKIHDVSLLTDKEHFILGRICQEGNINACSYYQRRKPASKE